MPFLLRLRLTPARSVTLNVSVKLVPEVISTLAVSVKVYVAPPSPVRVNLFATMSLVEPLRLTKPVPVTTSAPVLALYVALVIVGMATLDTVMPLPVRSWMLPLVMSLFQSSAAARL